MLAASLLLLFAALGLRLGFATVILSHVAFTVSYAFVVVRARIAGFDREPRGGGDGPGRRPAAHVPDGHAAGDLARRWLAAALLVFALSIDDYVVTSFVAGVGATTLPLQIYSMVKSGVSPEINAVSTLLLAATGAPAARRVPARAGPRVGGRPRCRWGSGSPCSARPSCWPAAGRPRGAC